MNKRIFVLLATVFFCVSIVLGDVIPASMFCDNAVLQRGMQVPVWGTADPGEKVTVTFDGQEKTVSADKDGNWMIRLDPMKANATGRELVIKGNNTVTCKGVLVGEVWHASGQSNMGWSILKSKIPDTDKIVAEADYPLIRFFRNGHSVSADPLNTCRGSWIICSPSAAPSLGAVAYFFAQELFTQIDVPVGMLMTPWGGRKIDVYMPRESFDIYPELKKELAADEEKIDALRKSPKDKAVIKESTQLSTVIFNTKVNPVVPYAIKGALWYQGESNVAPMEEAKLYDLKQRAMIQSWRKKWGQGDFPFYYVQLTPSSKWNRGILRECQRQTLGMKSTGMAVAVDVGGPSAHPPEKVVVGKRLAAWALAKDYGIDVPYSGPVYKDIRINGNEVVVEFDYIGGGLKVGKKDPFKAVKFLPGSDLDYFELASSDKNWHMAKAVIKGNTVVVSSESVAKPVAVRYFYYAPYTHTKLLYNKEGLPASPFISDLDMLDAERETELIEQKMKDAKAARNLKQREK
ncbi:sialate O-acetylesterase [Verrucomicrobiota bacterium]